MNCPLCKASGSLRVVLPILYVECVTPGCPWTSTPLDELVCDAAVYTWHRANPTPVDPAAMDFVHYDLHLDDLYREPGDLGIRRVTISGWSFVDSRRWDRKDRATAQAALDAFVADKAAA